MKKSIEIAINERPNGKIKSTQMVYPRLHLWNNGCDGSTKDYYWSAAYLLEILTGISENTFVEDYDLYFGEAVTENQQ